MYGINKTQMEDNEFMQDNQQPTQQPHHLSPAKKKLKKMTNDFFIPPTPQQIADKMKSISNQPPHTPTNTSPLDNYEPLHQTDPGTVPNTSNELTIPRKLSSSIRRSTTSANSLIYRPLPAQAYTESLLQRDKEKDPLKYKIISERLGVEEKRVLKLKKDEIDRIKDEYLRNKGIEYLRDPNLHPKRQKRAKTQTSPAPNHPQPNNSLPRDYVRQIFADLALANKAKAEKQGQINKKQARLQDLNDREEMLGKVVFHRVEKHLQAERNGMDYFRHIRDEETIDSALIDFLRTKVKKAQLALH